MPTKPMSDLERAALAELVYVHRGWCNYCRGNAQHCESCPEGGCSLRDYLRILPAQSGGEWVRYETFGYALAMRVLQSRLYHALDDEELAECDEMIRRGQHPPPADAGETKAAAQDQARNSGDSGLTGSAAPAVSASGPDYARAIYTCDRIADDWQQHRNEGEASEWAGMAEFIKKAEQHAARLQGALTIKSARVQELAQLRTRLEGEIAEARKNLRENFVKDVELLSAETRRAEAAERTVAELREYTRHKYTCYLLDANEEHAACTCGLSAALA